MSNMLHQMSLAISCLEGFSFSIRIPVSILPLPLPSSFCSSSSLLAHTQRYEILKKKKRDNFASLNNLWKLRGLWLHFKLSQFMRLSIAEAAGHCSNVQETDCFFEPSMLILYLTPSPPLSILPSSQSKQTACPCKLWRIPLILLLALLKILYFQTSILTLTPKMIINYNVEETDLSSCPCGGHLDNLACECKKAIYQQTLNQQLIFSMDLNQAETTHFLIDDY